MVRRFFPALLLLAFQACGYDGVPPSVLKPEHKNVAGAPARVTIEATLGVGIDADKAALVVHVSDTAGSPVSGALVGFATTSGTVSPSTVTADASGLAQARVVTASRATVTATAGQASAAIDVVPGTAATTPTPTAPGYPPDATRDFTLTLSADIVIVGTPTLLKASLSGAVFPLQTATWTFGDGATLVNTTYAAEHVYAAAGSYSASVSITDGNGRVGRAAVTIMVSPASSTPNPSPTPDPNLLGVSLSCTAGTSTINTSCNATVTDSKGAIVTVSVTEMDWDWGDGNSDIIKTGTPQNQHRFTQPGKFTIQVIAKIGTAKEGSASYTITIAT